MLTKPLILSCPLRRDLYGCDEERMHIREHGMYGPDRVLEIDQGHICGPCGHRAL